MNTDKTKQTRRREGARYETCRECGLEWNVSKNTAIHRNGYICPHCWSKNRPSKTQNKGARK